MARAIPENLFELLTIPLWITKRAPVCYCTFVLVLGKQRARKKKRAGKNPHRTRDINFTPENTTKRRNFRLKFKSRFVIGSRKSDPVVSLIEEKNTHEEQCEKKTTTINSPFLFARSSYWFVPRRALKICLFFDANIYTHTKL